MASETQGEEVSTIRARKGASDNNSSANNFSLVVLADSKHASMMLTKYSDAIRNGDAKKRRVGSELAEIKCGEAQTKY